MWHKLARDCAGITDKTEGGPFLLEAKQGDTISGNVSRDELARLVATALSTPEATGMTFGSCLHVCNRWYVDMIKHGRQCNHA